MLFEWKCRDCTVQVRGSKAFAMKIALDHMTAEWHLGVTEVEDDA